MSVVYEVGFKHQSVGWGIVSIFIISSCVDFNEPVTQRIGQSRDLNEIVTEIKTKH